MKDQVLRLLAQPDYIPATEPELLRRLRVPPARHPEFQPSLNELEQAGRIARIKGNRYVLPAEADLVPGRIRMTRQGRGFLIPDDSSLKEIAVPESATGTALHEDRVLVRRDVPPRGLRSDTAQPVSGRVIRILERRRTQIVGTLQRSQRFLYVVPDDPRIPHDIYVPEPRDVGRPARLGDKVVVELREWESRHTNPEGEIVEVLGAPDAEGVDMLSVLRQYSLPLHFPPDVLHEARAIGSVVRPEELAGREDCRSHQVVTIDPDDAKDFDDAICLQRAGPDQWKLWVHIADVSHYVKPGTALDDEARRRGNSTYLVDRVIPMLPEALSNELCSLKPQVDRLTKCVEFLLSDDGRVLKTRFFAAIIHSQRRFTYREAFEVLQRKPAGAIEEMLHDANALAQRIRQLRFKAGSLELDFPEMKIRLDEQGRVERIERIENDISHQLIEEFMLLANEAVAMRLIQQNRVAIHRVHEEPDPKRLEEYREEVLSHQVPCGNLRQRAEVQKLLHHLGTLAIGPALKIGFLKSMMRARYALEPLGHYGLAKKHYAHFTSPIRRYADLVVHRALFEHSHGAKHSVKETADHISITERNSADAERDSRDVKLYAFLRSQLEAAEPVRYPALVTDVRNFGFFVDVTGLAMSGLVPVSSMEDDFYIFDPERSHLVGRRTRTMIRLGDRVEVQVAKVDQFKKQVDFRLAGSKPVRAAGATRPRPDRGGKAPPSRRAEATARQGAERRRSQPARLAGSRPPQRPAGGRQPQKSRGGERTVPQRPQHPQRPPGQPQGQRGKPARHPQGRPTHGNSSPARPSQGRPSRGGQSPSPARPQQGRPPQGRAKLPVSAPKAGLIQSVQSSRRDAKLPERGPSRRSSDRREH
jgi:ribonuclease R